MISKKIFAIVVAVTMVMSAIVIIEKVTNEPIFKQPAKAWLTPGILSREGNGSLSIGTDVLNTSTGELYYENTLSYLEVNGELNWGSSTYYLYYPIYEGKYGNTYNLSWKKYLGNGADPPEIDRDTSGGGDYRFGGGFEGTINFNHSGLWLIDDDSIHDVSDLASITATVPAWFWVNTSTDLTLNVSDTSFKFGDDGSITLECTKGGTSFDALLAIHNVSGVLPGYGTNYQWNENKEFSSGEYSISKNSSLFTNAGEWYAEAYYDDDGGSTDAGSHTNYRDSPGDAGYDWFNKSLYGDDSGGTIEGQADQYSYEFGGPWDPPEWNSTPVTITVNTGQPTITLTNASPVYWGFDLFMQINVTAANNDPIPNGIIMLRKGSGLYYRGNDSGTPYDLTRWLINETGSTYGNGKHGGNDGEYSIYMQRAEDLSTCNWTNFSNGTWKLYFKLDSNGDGVEEYNHSKSFTVSSRTRDVDLVITNDGYSDTGDSTDMKLDVPDRTSGGPGGTGPADTYSIDFKIYGRAVTGSRAYYGDSGTGSGVEHPENWKNISITGDILKQVTPPDAGSEILTNNGDGTWTAQVTPTKPGGNITIGIDWPGSNNGSDSETLTIVNGTNVATNIESFTYGDDINLTVTVTNQQGIVENNAVVYLFWEGGGAINDSVNQTMTPTTNGEYTFWIKPGDQEATAPRNITIAAKTAGTTYWGYATVRMLKKHNLVVNVTPTMSYAGNAQEYDIDILVDGTTAPGTYSDITVALYHTDGTLVTATNDAWSYEGAYELDDQEIALSWGTYQLYAYNNTHDSEGNNATLTIEPYTVTSTPSVLAWLIDTAVDMTFQVNSPITNGTLTLNNMTSTPNGSDTTTSHTVTIENGIGTLEDVNATTLGNITFSYQPDGGYDRPAIGKVPITTATATSTPGTIYVGESTEVTILVTHPESGDPVADVLVGLDQGMNLSDSILAKLPDPKETGTDGKVIFGIEPEATGNVTIYLKGGTDPTNPQVIKAQIKKDLTVTTDPLSVYEGTGFTVIVKDVNDIGVEGATVKFHGNDYTTNSNGEVTIEYTDDETIYPDVPSTPGYLPYPIKAAKEGYKTANCEIQIVNKPKIYLTVEGATVDADGNYKLTEGTVTISAGGDDGNEFGITITITKDGTAYQTGTAPLTVDMSGGAGTYTVTATKDGYLDADQVTVIIEPAEDGGNGPGFELLTLIIAIGVAFILLRRRRKN